jgi:signal peptidase I
LIDTPAIVWGEPGVLTRLSPRVRRGLVIGAVVLLVLLVLRTFVVQVVEVEGPSMEPTLGSRTWVVIDQLSASRVDRGSVIVFSAPDGSGATHGDLVKRAIATAGQRVSMRDCVVYVDGVALAEPYLFAEQACGTSEIAELTVPAGAVYVLGDHRSESLDSRAFGPIPVGSVHGRVMGGLWPF